MWNSGLGSRPRPVEIVASRILGLRTSACPLGVIVLGRFDVQAVRLDVRLVVLVLCARPVLFIRHLGPPRSVRAPTAPSHHMTAIAASIFPPLSCCRKREMRCWHPRGLQPASRDPGALRGSLSECRPSQAGAGLGQLEPRKPCLRDRGRRLRVRGGRHRSRRHRRLRTARRRGRSSSWLAVFADRRPRRQVLIATDLGRAGMLGALAVLAPLDDTRPAVYVLAIATAVLEPLFRSAQVAHTPALVTSPQELTAANVLASGVESVALFAGPAVGALLLAVSSPSAVFAVTACLALAAVALVARIGIAGEPEPDAGSVGRTRCLQAGVRSRPRRICAS